MGSAGSSTREINSNFSAPDSSASLSRYAGAVPAVTVVSVPFLLDTEEKLRAAVAPGSDLRKLLADVTLFPQTLINVRLQPGQDWKTNTLLADETKAVEAELGDTGRVLIRASGTEPLLRVMVEARDPQQAQACAERLVNAVKSQVPA